MSSSFSRWRSWYCCCTAAAATAATRLQWEQQHARITRRSSAQDGTDKGRRKLPQQAKLFNSADCSDHPAATCVAYADARHRREAGQGKGDASLQPPHRRPTDLASSSS